MSRPDSQHETWRLDIYATDATRGETQVSTKLIKIHFFLLHRMDEPTSKNSLVVAASHNFIILFCLVCWRENDKVKCLTSLFIADWGAWMAALQVTIMDSFPQNVTQGKKARNHGSDRTNSGPPLPWRPVLSYNQSNPCRHIFTSLLLLFFLFFLCHWKYFRVTIFHKL